MARLWARNGREFLCQLQREADRGGRRTTGALGGPFLWNLAQGSNYDIAPDGQRFLTVQGSDSNVTQLNVVLNWFEELKQRVPVK